MEVELGININKKLSYLSQTPTVTIPHTGTNYATVNITPVVGQIGKINSLYIYIPSIPGSTGNHTLYIYAGNDVNSRILSISAPGTNAIKMQGLSVNGTNNTPIPASDSAIAFVLNELRFDYDTPLKISYHNDTDTDQTAQRTYNVQYMLEGEGVL